MCGEPIEEGAAGFELRARKVTRRPCAPDRSSPGDYHCRADRRPHIGLGAGCIGHALMRHAEPVEVGLDPLDQREVRVTARRVEADERFEDSNGPLRAHYSLNVAVQAASYQCLCACTLWTPVRWVPA